MNYNFAAKKDFSSISTLWFVFFLYMKIIPSPMWVFLSIVSWYLLMVPLFLEFFKIKLFSEMSRKSINGYLCESRIVDEEKKKRWLGYQTFIFNILHTVAECRIRLSDCFIQVMLFISHFFIFLKWTNEFRPNILFILVCCWYNSGKRFSRFSLSLAVSWNIGVRCKCEWTNHYSEI